MAQLVGTPCVFCTTGITNELDADFCPTCGQASHVACRTTQAGGEGKCGACGATFDPAVAKKWAEDVKRSAAMRQTETAQVPAPTTTQSLNNLVDGYRELKRFYRFATFIIGGVLIVIVGILLVFDSDMRSNPAKLTFADVARDCVTILAGVAMIFLGWWQYRSTRRNWTTKTGRVRDRRPS